MELHSKGKALGDGGKRNKSSSSAWAKRRKKYIAKRQNVDTASLTRVTEQHHGKNAVVDRQCVLDHDKLYSRFSSHQQNALIKGNGAIFGASALAVTDVIHIIAACCSR